VNRNIWKYKTKTELKQRVLSILGRRRACGLLLCCLRILLGRRGLDPGLASFCGSGGLFFAGFFLGEELFGFEGGDAARAYNC
jgi:hypothetical protein